MRDNPQFITHPVPVTAVTPTPYGEGTKLMLALDHCPTDIRAGRPTDGYCNVILSPMSARALIACLRAGYSSLGLQWHFYRAGDPERWTLQLNTPIHYKLQLKLAPDECCALAEAIERTLFVEWNPEKEANRRAALGNTRAVALTRMI